MAAKVKELKSAMICAVCNAEFTGKKCPECGNMKGNQELAPDGIPTGAHAESTTFGNVTSLKPTDMALNEEYIMSQELARSQREEMQSNLRDSFVLKSELKKRDLEEALRRKKEEYEPIHVPSASAPQPEPQQSPMMTMIPQSPMNPQAQFMNHFMKFSAEERTEFLDQLAEADPAAMNTLSGFFSQPNPMMQQQPMTNPYMQPPMNPYMQFPPPWMQQQQYEQQAPVKDPTEAAIDMVDKLQEMSERGRRNEPSESTSMIAGLRDELKAMNERISSMNAESQNNQNEAIMQRLGQMENQMYNPKPSGGLKDQIHEIKVMVTDLQDIGMMQKPESKNTVEEQIQLSEAKHRIEKENREFDMEEQKLDTERAQKDMNKSLVKGLFQRQLRKTLGHEEDAGPPPVAQQPVATQQCTGQVCKLPNASAVVVEEFTSDAGVVRETRPPVRSEE